MPVIMIVVTGSATNLCRLSIHEGNDGVIGDAATFYAVIVNDIAESLFTPHHICRQARVYQETAVYCTCASTTTVSAKGWAITSVKLRFPTCTAR
jgi:hypothetical protein